MAKNTDYQARAAEFLRQWQEAVTRQMTDPNTLATMLAAIQTFGAPHDANARRSSHASDAGDDAIGHLAQRLDALERRIAALHTRLDATEKPTRTKRRAAAGTVAKGKRGVGRGAKSKPAKRISKRKK